MKFNVNQQDLQQALSYCQGVIEKRSTLQILSNVLLDVNSSKLTITATDLDLIFVHQIKNVEVIEEGKTIGNAEEAIEIDLDQYTLQSADLEIAITEPYIPVYDKPEDLDNEYRCFVLEHGKDENFYIEALYPKIDNASIVHHIVLAKAARDSLIEGADNPQGIDCLGGAQDLIIIIYYLKKNPLNKFNGNTIKYMSH
mgnify:CR=1 FL=1